MAGRAHRGEEPEGGLLWIPDLRAQPVEERSSGVLGLAWGHREQTEAKPQLGRAACGNLSWTWTRVQLEQQKWLGARLWVPPPTAPAPAPGPGSQAQGQTQGATMFVHLLTDTG